MFEPVRCMGYGGFTTSPRSPPGTWKLDYIVLDFQDLIYALHKWSPLLQISIDKHMRMSIALSDMGQSGRVLIVKACKKICVEDFYDFSR